MVVDHSNVNPPSPPPQTKPGPVAASAVRKKGKATKILWGITLCLLRTFMRVKTVLLRRKPAREPLRTGRACGSTTAKQVHHRL